MLAKINRLRREKEIELVFRKGRNFKEGFLILKTIKNNLGCHRFALIVSKKVSLKANLRNKIRRKISEIIRLKIKSIKIKEGTDNLIIALPGLENKDFREINETLEKLFSKTSIQ